MKYVQLILILCLAAGLAVAEQTETLTLEAGGLDGLRIACGAGSLKVTGGEDLKEITVTAVIRGQEWTKAEVAKYITLTDEKGKARLHVESKEKSGMLGMGGTSCEVDLTVTMPRGFALDITDGSGGIVVADVDGALDITDGSGGIEARTLGGRVVITDGSGSIEITACRAGITIKDGSGAIRLSDIGGPLDITDGSGGIDIQKVTGPVTINDGSGSIRIQGVETDVTIESDGSGSVTISDVKGTVTQPEED